MSHSNLVNSTIPTEKFCNKCKVIKSISDFGKDRKRKYGITTSCKKCRNPQSKAWRMANPEKVKEINKLSKEKRKEYYSSPERKFKYRNLELKRAFGITHKEYEQLLSKQNGVCGICKRYKIAKNKFHMTIDHSHKNGEIRGILCSSCNTGLGLFEDNVDFLENAKKYLKGEIK